MSAVDALAALRLLVEWGADEALQAEPLDRFAPLVAPPRAVFALPRQALPQATTASLAASNLDELHAALQTFEGCALRTTATNTVRPDGNPDAGLVLIGDAPGADDDRSGRAFSGLPGELLDRVLRSIGLERNKLLLTTVVPWRPPGNRPVSEAEVQACLPFLHHMLVLIRPGHLVLLGAGPVRALTSNTDPIRKLRGRWLDAIIPGLSAPIPALPLPQLDQWMRSPAAKRDLWSDLLRLQPMVTTG